jgi:hypothetical protein
MGQAPPAHEPDGQRPMLQESAFPAATAALKLENCFDTFFDPQDGQAEAGSVELRTSVSKPLPQFSH